MRKMPGKAGVAVIFGTLILIGGISGCSMFSSSNTPVDCDAVKNQEQAGVSDAMIASNLGATVDKVAACHGAKTSTGAQELDK